MQEDSLVLDWDLTLAFRRGKHESFRVRIPADYLVVSISGENVRGWENFESDSPNEALIDVELLHAAQETERFNISLMRTADFENAKDTTVTTPNVGVVGAAMHHGRVTLQNSPRLDIKTTDVANASMTDLPETQNRSDTGKNLSDNPFGLKTYRSYRFTTENYRLPLAVNLLQVQPTCTMRSIVKLAPYELKLESNYQLYSPIQSESRFSERLLLPLGMQLDSVTSELPIEWSTKPLESGETELTVIWPVIPNSRHVQFNIRGTVMRVEDKQADLCVILPQDSQSVRHEFVIQSDPAFDVALHEKNNLSERAQMSLHWIVEAQRPFCRKELFATTNNNGQNVPSAKLSLIPREPVISSESITNVQVNSRSIEETILLDFNIQNAGIRSVEFELPKSMADAKINAPLLQRKEIVADENGDSVRVTLRLQDEIMNEFRVLIRSNHELVSGKTYRTTIPKIKTGNVLNQFIVLENAGSLDELKVDETKLVGMQRISRQNKEWNNLAAILGDGATDAYLVSDQTKPQLAFNMVRRETVKMSGARIGLAETRVVLGENGDYLAEQIYRIDNKTEQFLDLKLPKGAELWTVRILTNQEWEAKQSGAAGDFGQPVKPTKLPKTDASGKVSDMPSGVRIPIIKTEVGDLDYVVRIVYAGKCGPIRWASKLDIPFIEVLNIPVGASYARLHLPEDYKFRFDGTMTQSDQGAVAKTISEYDKQVNAKLQQAAQTGNPYEQARALSNLSLKGMLPEMPLSSSRPVYDQRGARSYTVTPPVYETQTGQMMGRRPGYEMQNDSEPFFLSNDVQLEQRFAEQSNRRSQNVVVQSDSNWKVEHAPSTAVVTDESGQAFNRQWLGKNNLENPLNNDKKAESAYNQPAPASQVASGVERSEERLPEVRFAAPQVNESRSSRVNADNRGVQQAPVMALQGQERLKDSGLASKLSNSQMPVPQTTQPSRPASQAEMSTMGGKPQQQAPADNLALYQRRLAAQNADSNLTVNGANVIPMETPVPSGFGGGMTSAGENYGGRGSYGGVGGMAGQGGGYGGGPGGMSGGQAAGRSAASSSGVVVGDAFSNSVKNSSHLAGLNPYREETQHISGEIAVYASPLTDPQGMAACKPVSGGTTVMGAFDSKVMSTTMAVKAASLDIEIPNTGTVYFFTAPQAENRLSLSGVSASTSQRTKDFGYVAGMLAVCGLVGFLVVRRKRSS